MANATQTSSQSVTVRERAQGLANKFIQTNAPEKLAWDWGPAFFLYGLSKFLPTVSETKQKDYVSYIDAYHRSYEVRDEVSGLSEFDSEEAEEVAPASSALRGNKKKKLPVINWSDRCPSVLSALRLQMDHGNSIGMPAALKVADYVKYETRNGLGALDHMGRKLWRRKLYPNSIWVDSLVMYGVFSAQWAAYTGDSELMDFAVSQPLIFASVLHDKDAHLFRHAYDWKKGRLIPKKPGGFWLRGNGWAMASMVELLDVVPLNHPKRPELLALFQSTAEGALVYQKANGLWPTIMNRPNYYEETSGSTILAYAFAKGARLGYLDARFRTASEKVMNGLEPYVKEITTAGSSEGATESARDNRLFSMSGISWWTIPGPDWLYRMMPRKSDLPYGVGAYLLAATEY